jgi:hypothetical protein
MGHPLAGYALAILRRTRSGDTVLTWPVSPGSGEQLPTLADVGDLPGRNVNTSRRGLSPTT